MTLHASPNATQLAGCGITSARLAPRRNGVIRHSHVYPPGTIPESKDLLERLAQM